MIKSKSKPKRCFSTLCCLEDSARQVIEYAVKNCMDGVEVRVNEGGEAFGHRTVAQAEEIRRLFDDAGIVITDLALSCSIKECDRHQIETGRNGIDFAAALGSKAVRIFVGEHQAHFDDTVKNDIDGMRKALWELSDYGKEKGVDILLETHSSFSSGKAMRGLIDILDRDNIKVIWDVIHTLEYRETPSETVRVLGDKIVHVHLKDGRPDSDDTVTQYVHTDLGKGVVSSDEVLKALSDIGYNGYFSLEWESPWRREIQKLYGDVNDLLACYNRFLDGTI